MGKVIIIMGSKSDLEHCRKMAGVLEGFGVKYTLRVASAHKVPLKVLNIIKEYEREEEIVFITVAGRSNALSGFVDANTAKPVIACPTYGDKYTVEDIFSSIRIPSGVCPLFILEPEQAALAAVKILSLKDDDLRRKVKEYQDKKKIEIEEADKEVQR